LQSRAVFSYCVEYLTLTQSAGSRHKDALHVTFVS